MAGKRRTCPSVSERQLPRLPLHFLAALFTMVTPQLVSLFSRLVHALSSFVLLARA